MKTQIWNKTTIFWDMPEGDLIEKKTNIPVDDWHDKRKKYFHAVTGMQIVSNLNEREEDRTATIILEIKRATCPPTTKRGEIISRLEKLDDSIISVINEEFEHTFKVNYKLESRESFCDSAINKARLVLKALGIDDQKGFILSNFLPIQETLVKTQNGWVPYGDYLRHKHELPPVCFLYDRKIRIDGLEIKINYPNSLSNLLQQFK